MTSNVEGTGNGNISTALTRTKEAERPMFLFNFYGKMLLLAYSHSLTVSFKTSSHTLFSQNVWTYCYHVLSCWQVCEKVFQCRLPIDWPCPCNVDELSFHLEFWYRICWWYHLLLSSYDDPNASQNVNWWICRWGRAVIGFYLSFSKTFNIISHNIVLCVLYKDVILSISNKTMMGFSK